MQHPPKWHQIGKSVLECINSGKMKTLMQVNTEYIITPSIRENIMNPRIGESVITHINSGPSLNNQTLTLENNVLIDIRL